MYSNIYYTIYYTIYYNIYYNILIVLQIIMSFLFFNLNKTKLKLLNSKYYLLYYIINY